MNARVPLLATACLCFLAAACAPAEQAEPAGGETVSTEADVEAIHALMDRWTVGLNTEDTDAMMAILTENTTHLPPNEPALTGQAAVRSWFDRIFAGEGAVAFTIETADVKVGGDWAAGRGTYSSTATDESGEATTITGKWIVLYERGADGAWRGSSTIWNIDMPGEWDMSAE